MSQNMIPIGLLQKVLSSGPTQFLFAHGRIAAQVYTWAFSNLGHGSLFSQGQSFMQTDNTEGCSYLILRTFQAKSFHEISHR